jgi:hypothetical protein
MNAAILQQLPCCICAISVMVLYTFRIMEEGRQYHPKQTSGDLESPKARFPQQTATGNSPLSTARLRADR